METNFIVVDAEGKAFAFSNKCSLKGLSEVGKSEYSVFCEGKLLAVFVNPIRIVAEPKLFVENVQEF